MGRWFLTSDEKAYVRAGRTCRNAGLTQTGLRNEAGCFIEAYGKRTAPVENFIDYGDGDWVCSSGTIIHNGDLGSGVLHFCYESILSEGVQKLRSKLLGHYAVAVKHGNHITIFTDPQGALTLYYAKVDSSDWFLSNSLHTCASALSKRVIDRTALIGAAFQASNPGRYTFYSGVKRLFGKQVITIDSKQKEFQVRRLPSENETLTSYPFEDTVTRYKKEVQSVFGQLSEVGSVGLMATGGLDSRMVLSALLNQNTEPLLLYGTGNSSLTNTQVSDHRLISQIANDLGLHLYEMDWSGEQPYSTKTLETLFQKFGFKFEVYGGSTSFLDELEGRISPYPDLMLGGYSPALTNMKLWELDAQTFTGDILRGHYTSDCIRNRFFRCEEEYVGYIKQAVDDALQYSGIEKINDSFSLSDFVQARLFLYLRAESRFLNLANEFGSYVAPFLLKRLYDPLVCMPFEHRRKDKFQVSLIHDMFPALLGYPLFSGLRKARVDERMEVSFVESGEKKNVAKDSQTLNRIGSLLPPSLKKPLRRLHQLYLHTRRKWKSENVERMDIDRNIRLEYASSVAQDPLLRPCIDSVEGEFMLRSEIPLKELVRLRHYIVGVNKLGYAEAE
jgi:hypothetical protein